MVYYCHADRFDRRALGFFAIGCMGRDVREILKAEVRIVRLKQNFRWSTSV